MRVILLGKPGCGKGTQAKRMAGRLGVPAISTGDLIRAAIVSGSDLGARFASFTNRGQLVPDELVLAIVAGRLKSEDTREGFLMDGFPRTEGQALALEETLRERGESLRAVLDIEVADPALLERAAGRRFCPADGRSYHVAFAKPEVPGVCDACGGALERRADDREEVVMARLVEYRKKTAPLVAFYRERGLLRAVDGMGSPEEVGARIEAALRG